MMTIITMMTLMMMTDVYYYGDGAYNDDCGCLYLFKIQTSQISGLSRALTL